MRRWPRQLKRRESGERAVAAEARVIAAVEMTEAAMAVEVRAAARAAAERVADTEMEARAEVTAEATAMVVAAMAAEWRAVGGDEGRQWRRGRWRRGRRRR